MMSRYHFVTPFANIDCLWRFREVSKGWTIRNQKGKALGIVLSPSRATGISSIPQLHCLQDCKLHKIVTSVQSTIQDLETSIVQTESIITDFHIFKHPTSKDPTLVEPGTILLLSNLATIKLFTNIYTSQVKAKQKLVCTINIACGRHNDSTTAEFVHANNEH